MSLSHVEGILFDLDGTLTDYQASARAGLKEVYRLLSSDDIPFSEFEKVFHFIIEQESKITTKTGIRYSTEENRKRRFLSVFHLLGITNFGDTDALSGAYGRGRSLGASLFPGVRELLTDLFEIYPLGVITEGSVETQMAQLERQRITEYFSEFVISGATPYHKPALALYELAVDKMQMMANRIVMVGDRLDWDILPAKKTGMQTVYFQHDFNEVLTGEEKSSCDVIIHDIRELSFVLKADNQD